MSGSGWESHERADEHLFFFMTTICTQQCNYPIVIISLPFDNPCVVALVPVIYYPYVTRESTVESNFFTLIKMLPTRPELLTTKHIQYE